MDLTKPFLFSLEQKYNRRMMSVVSDRPFLHVFDRLGRLIFLILLGFLPGFDLSCTDGQFLSAF